MLMAADIIQSTDLDALPHELGAADVGAGPQAGLYGERGTYTQAKAKEKQVCVGHQQTGM
jgi:hypothetical protein